MEIIKASHCETFKTTNVEAAKFIKGLFDGSVSISDVEGLDEEAKDVVKTYLDWNQLYKDKYFDDARYYLKEDLVQVWKNDGEYDDFDAFVEDMFEEAN